MACDPTLRGTPALQLLAGDVALLWSIAAALPLVEFEAPEPRGFARRVGNALVDAANMPSFKTDVVVFRLDCVVFELIFIFAQDRPQNVGVIVCPGGHLGFDPMPPWARRQVA